MIRCSAFGKTTLSPSTEPRGLPPFFVTARSATRAQSAFPRSIRGGCLDTIKTLAIPMGLQSVVFGAAAPTPDVARGDNFGSPSFFNEAGGFNSIFTTAGNYRFDFSFQNIGGNAGYPDVYLLAHTVPEPSSIVLAAGG